MQQSKLVRGGDILIWVGNRVIAYASSSSLSLNVETQEVTNKDAGGGLYASAVASKISWSMSTSNLYAYKPLNPEEVEFKDLMYYAKNGLEVSVTIGHTQNADPANADLETPPAHIDEIPSTENGWKPTGIGWKGQALITSISLNAEVGNNASYDVEFQGIGKLEDLVTYTGKEEYTTPTTGDTD